jgi:hypothetical protein
VSICGFFLKSSPYSFQVVDDGLKITVPRGQYDFRGIPVGRVAVEESNLESLVFVVLVVAMLLGNGVLASICCIIVALIVCSDRYSRYPEWSLNRLWRRFLIATIARNRPIRPDFVQSEILDLLKKSPEPIRVLQVEQRQLDLSIEIEVCCENPSGLLAYLDQALSR